VSSGRWSEVSTDEQAHIVRTLAAHPFILLTGQSDNLQKLSNLIRVKKVEGISVSVEVVVSAKTTPSCSVASFSGMKSLNNKTMARILGLAASAAMLVLLAACNTNANISGVGCPGNTGSFNNASLPSGSQWTFELSGWQANSVNSSGSSPYREAGVFTVDGNGNITSATDDFYQQGLGGATGYITTTGITGTYSITSNGTGSVTLSFPNGQETWAITMQGNSFYIMEADTFAGAQGVAHLQTGPFAAPTGTFAFRTHALGNVSGFSAAVGEMTVSGGSITGGSVDYLNGGVLSTVAASGSFGAPDTTGRGSALIGYGGSSFTFEYYVIDQNTVELFETDSNLALGRMEAQTGAGSFNDASFSGPYAFGSFGDTVNGYGGTNTVGQITADGSGNLTSGSYDGAQDGTVASVAGLLAGSNYSVAANGRFTMTINGAGAAPQQVIGYLVNAPATAGRAFFLFNSTSKAEDGTMDLQSSASFAASDVTGQFAMVMGGFDPTDIVDRSGVFQTDGNGNINAAYVLNRTGVVTAPGCLTGTYTVGANGRVVVSINSLSNNVVLYMVNPNQAYMIQADGSTEIYGGMALQGAPVLDPPGGF
jgi:hypothetical protein